MAEAPKTGLFAAMNKNARLRKHMAKAKTAEAAREFDGPDGDYECNFKRYSTYDKDGTTNVVFEFRTTENCAEYSEQKIVIFIKLADGPIRTAEEEQDLLFQMIQLMGIDTQQDDVAIEKALTALTQSNEVITLRCKSSKPKNKGDRIFKNFSVVGVATEGRTDYEYKTETPEDESSPVPSADEESWDDSPTEEADEWNDVEAEEEVIPSSYVGQTCIYKGKKCTLIHADDESGQCVIEDAATKRRKSNAEFNDLEWP